MTENSSNRGVPAPRPGLYLGAAYYPEQWPEERWPEDIQLMKEAGLNVVRMGEFAWSMLEPAEGEFHFDWLERVIDLLAGEGIFTVLGTPTASPPAWLVTQFPDMMAIDENGSKVQFGNRCHYCVTSPDFHTAVQRLVSAMAERFGPNSHVIGWQLDNEYSRVCYCDRCREGFQSFLEAKYQTLDSLNEHWTTAYWSQTYSDWKQIPIPIGPHNPGLMLEFKRYVTENYARFQRLQINALRPHLPKQVWITHNFMGWYDGFDHYKMSKDLDMVSWDWYIGTGHNQYQHTGAMHDLTRGFKRSNFWVMETQPGSVNWSSVNSVLNKGEARAMAWEAVAHGAEGLLYWQWRSALNGQEQYHGTLIDQSGNPRPFYEDVQQLGKEFAAVSDLVAGSRIRSKVAILFSYESRWSIQWQPHHKDFNYVRYLVESYYRIFAKNNIQVDIIGADTLTHHMQLEDYRMVIAPCLQIVDDPLKIVLEDFVRRGGHLVLTIRSGVKDRFNALLPSRPPGLLSNLSGIEIEEYYALDESVPLKANWFEGSVHTWAERIRFLDQKTLRIGWYLESNGWLDGKTAISLTGFSSGMVYYVGAYLDERAQTELVERFIRTAGLRQLITPEGTEVRTRLKADGTEIYFIINHSSTEVTMWLPWRALDHLQGITTDSELKLAPYQTAIVTRVQEEKEA